MIKKILGAIRSILKFLFGSFSWEFPGWLNWIIQKIRSIFSRIKDEHKINKKRFYGIVVAILLIVIGGAQTYKWYVNLPRPVKYSLNGSLIRPTPLKKDKRPDIYTIKFSGSAAKLGDVGKKITKGIKIRPKLEGDWKWTSDNILSFTIRGDWPISRKYKVYLGKELFPDHVHLEKYEMEFSTPKFKAQIQSAFFYQSPKKKNDKKVIAEVHFSHPVNPKSFEGNTKFIFQVLGAKKKVIKEKEVTFKVTYDKFHGKAFLLSENLAIPNYESMMRIKIGKDVRAHLKGQGTIEKLESSVKIPGMLTHFRFKNALLKLIRNKDYEQEQVLILNSTAEINLKEMTNHLEVYSLPKDLPSLFEGQKAKRRYRWNVNSVSSKILSLSKKIELTSIPTENEFSKMISYKYKEKPATYLYIHIKKGLEAFGGYRLPEGRSFVVKVPSYRKELKIMANGSLLSLTGEKKLSILARGLKHVRYRAQRLLPWEIAHYVTQTNGDFENPYFESYNFGVENISKSFNVIRALPQAGKGKPQYSHFDFTRIIKKDSNKAKGLFYFVAEGWNYAKKRRKGPVDRRFILVTDIGILAKKSVNKEYDLFIQSISNGKPISGASVLVLGKNGLPILSKKSNENGHVRFPNLKSFKREKSPVVFVVIKGNDLSFLPIHKHVRRVNYSRFDIGGVYTSRQKDPIGGYLFSDRGIYRPGEEIHIGFIAKYKNWARDLSGVNLEMRVVDPKGSTIRNTKNIKLNEEGLESYSFKTGETWPTGTYNITLFVRKNKNRVVRIGSTSVRVEEFMPDRMKISARFSKPVNKGWLHPEGLKGLVTLQNLFGTPAQNRRISGELSLAPSYPSFHSFKEWHFHDPMRSKKSFVEKLGYKKSDLEGKVTFDLGLNKFESASYLLRFVAEGFEAEGGRSVVASNAVLISPLDYLVGYKSEGSLSYIRKGAKIGVDFIAINPDLKKVDAKDLKLKLIEFRQISTLVKQHNGTFKYESVKKEYEVKKNDFKILATGNSFKIDTSKPGDFALVILNMNNLELNRVLYSVAGAANLSFELEKNAELKVKLSKKDYNPGEEIEINIRAPYVGAGLITIERDRVYAHKWFVSNTKSSIQKITVPSNLEGNGYINVTFVRSLDSNEIFMSPFSTAVMPFSINKSERVNKIILKIPELVRPGENLAMNVSAIKKGKAIVFAINEGILQVAKYKNPDPLKNFYKKRALEVETRQILDLILPEFSKLSLKRSSEAGGAGSLLGKNMNPFKRKKDRPVAYWSGVIDIGPKQKTLNYKVPDYFSGGIRVIAVAVSKEAMDAVSDKTTVRGHFVLSPNIPTFVSPGDKLKVSLGISNNLKKSGKGAEIKVEVKTTSNIQIVGQKVVTLKIDENSESFINFDVAVGSSLGNTEFIFTASHKNKKSKRIVLTSIRPATPYMTTIQVGHIEGKDRKSISTSRKVYDEFRLNEVTVSKLPMALSKSFISYLKKYPYGCTEQIVSKGFPTVILGGYSEFKTTKAKAALQIQGVIELLAARQLPDGSFLKWAGNSIRNNFHSAYAFHYLTEARDRGYKIPKDLMERSISYAKSLIDRPPKDISMARVHAYMAYLLTRNEIIATKALTTLEKWFNDNKYEEISSDILLVYMASAYKLMKGDDKANSLLGQFDPSKKMLTDYTKGVFDETIKKVSHLYLVAKHFPEKMSYFDANRMKLLSTSLAESYNTVSSALSIMAFEAYGQQVGQKDLSGVLISEVINKKENSLRLIGTLFPKANFRPQVSGINISNTANKLVFYSVFQAGFDKRASTKKISKGLDVFREYLNEAGEVINKVKVGEKVKVRIRGRTTGDTFAPNIAIVDLLPGGFEVVLDSIKRNGNRFEYIDAREDRVLIFGTLGPKIETFEYTIKATNKGTYDVSPIFAESMYDRGLKFKGTTKKIVVE